MAPHRPEGHPCFIPPHPDLLARLKNDKDAATFRNQGSAALRVQTKRVGGETRILGLNDGMIFPKSHFDKPVSASKLASAALERAPLRGPLRVAVVLADFQDVKMKPGTKERFQDLFFSTGKIATGSVTEYYNEVSHGQISLTGEVIGPFTLSQNMSYYANNNYGRGWPGPNSQTMADEALTAAIGKMDFKPYDNDGNGYVDAFVVVHAGRAADESGQLSDLWSVKWNIPEERDAGGVKVFGFLTVGEEARCGVCAHEIGHLVFGWPDLYDTDYSSDGIGNWCLMSFGSWGGGGDRPVHPSAWCKANQGWIEVVTEKDNHQITLQDVKQGYKTHRLWTNGDSASQEYYLLENRQLTGFDASLPGPGLLVWHIDDAVFSNTDENHPKVKLMQADGFEQLKVVSGRGDAGDPFPGSSANGNFTSISNPSSVAYSGTDTFVSVTNIPASSASMTFNITVKPFDQPPPTTGPFNAKTWYRIKNTFAGNSLDIINDNGTNSTGLVQMARDGNFSGQHWQLVPKGPDEYLLRSLFLGPTRQLDVYGDDKTKVVLQNAGPFSGQFWTIKAWGDKTWHLENAYSGPNLYLDTMEGGPRVAMNAKNEGRPTERWTIEPIRAIEESEGPNSWRFW